MKSAVRFSKLEYANKYDSHADSLYRFALCVTGDRRIAGTAMAQLFSEGYFSCEDENFETHMLKVLWRILQSCPYGTEEAYRQNMKALLPDESQQRMIEKLSHLSPKERAQTPAALKYFVSFSLVRRWICSGLSSSLEGTVTTT